MPPATDTIMLYRGEDVDLDFTLTPVENITGWTTEFCVHGTAIVRAGSVIDAAQGKFRVSLVEADTASLSPGNYRYEAWRTNSGSRRVLAIGSFDILATR